MKSIKRRFKRVLKDIEKSASELLLISADLTLLAQIHQLAEQVSKAEAELRKAASELKKEDFQEGIADCEAWLIFEEIVDTDAISSLEDVFFEEMENQADSGLGEFLQQLLEKIQIRYNKMLADIQELLALVQD
jgi:hypothetical protein